jgi:hypothetical protein
LNAIKNGNGIISPYHPLFDRNSSIFFVPFADLFIHFSFAKLIFPSIFFIFQNFRSLDGLPTTIDGGYLISTTPKECLYRFSMAHSKRIWSSHYLFTCHGHRPEE